MQFEYPLKWPMQQPKTGRAKSSKFKKTSPYRSGEELFKELKRLGAENIIISSNLRKHLKGDGFYAKQYIDDVGVAVYFEKKGTQKVMACDRWDRVECNLHALALSIAAIRGLERWGGSDFLDGLFTGFAALPAGRSTTEQTNYFSGIDNLEDLKIRFRKLARDLHPDMQNGSHDKFVEMKIDYDALATKLK